MNTNLFNIIIETILSASAVKTPEISFEIVGDLNSKLMDDLKAWARQRNLHMALNYQTRMIEVSHISFSESRRELCILF